MSKDLPNPDADRSETEAREPWLPVIAKAALAIGEVAVAALLPTRSRPRRPSNPR